MQTINLNEKMTIGEILNFSMEIFTKNFKVFLNISLIFLIPVALLSIFNIDGTIQFQQAISNMNAGNFDISIFKSINTLSSFYIIEIILLMYYRMVIVKSAGKIISGEMFSQKVIISEVLKKFFPIFFTSLLVGLMVIFGFILCLIPGLILMGMLLFIPQIMMLEDRYYFGSFDRSFFIIKNNFWQTVLIPVIIMIVYSIITSISSMIISFTAYGDFFVDAFSKGEVNEGLLSIKKWAFILQNMISYAALILITPILNIALTLKFMNLKNIKEGLGIVSDLNNSGNNIE